MDDLELFRNLLGIGLPEYFGHRDLDDGRHICVIPLTYGRARLVIARDTRHEGYDEGF